LELKSWVHCLPVSAIKLRVGKDSAARDIFELLAATMPIDVEPYYARSCHGSSEGMKSRYASSGAREALATLSLQSHYTYVIGLL